MLDLYLRTLIILMFTKPDQYVVRRLVFDSLLWITELLPHVKQVRATTTREADQIHGCH